MNINLPNTVSEFLFFEDIPSYILVVSLVFIVSLFLIMIVNLIDKLKPRSKEEVLGEGAYQDALRILDKARVESLKIMSRAQNRAQNVMDSTYLLTKEAKDELDLRIKDVYKNQEDYLKKLTQDLLSSFKIAVEKGREENIRTLVETTETLKKEALSDVDEFKNMLKAETIEVKEELGDKMRADYAQVEAEIKSYKEEKVKELNDRVLDILSEVYTEVIGKDLDQKKYEEMVLRLLKDEIRVSGLGSSSSNG